MTLNYLSKFLNNYIIGYIILSLIIFKDTVIYANLANLTSNDPFPLFSSVYPYSYLTAKQKANLSFFDYDYPPTSFRASVSGYRQFANYARDCDGNAINIGDNPNGRWNMLGLFYDPILRYKLFNLLKLTFLPLPLGSCTQILPLDDNNIVNNNNTFCLITDPDLSDPNQEFGFFTIPAIYRKYGLRFETEFLILDRCFYSVGLKFQIGVANVKQMALRFDDLTCQSIGTTCPAFSGSPTPNTCTQPAPAIPVVVNPKFTNTDDTAIVVPPCLTSDGPVATSPCVPQKQTFKPCCNQKLCLTFPADAKRIVIEYIMRQRQLIDKYLGINSLKYDHVGMEDFRIYLFWRRVFVINQESELYPRLLFTPFVEAGAALPLDTQFTTNKFFGIPVGNNSHVSTGATFGGTLDFLDVIDFIFQVGFTKFFSREYCNYRLPTHEKESGIYPYTADIKRTPGTTWFTGFGFNAYRFIDNLSLWLEYLIVKHRQDDIHVCKSYIPTTSIYYNQGFLVKEYEAQTRWGSQFVNVGFNYDLADDFSLGFLWQVASRERNAFRPTTVMGTISFIY